MKSRRALSCVLLLSLTLSLGPRELFAQQTEPFHNPYLRGTESLLLPGLGQWHNGDGNRGALWAGLGAFGLLFASKFISFSDGENSIHFWRTAGWVAYGLTASVSAYDAYRQARSLNRENGYEIEDFANSLRRGGDPGVRLTLLRYGF